MNRFEGLDSVLNRFFARLNQSRNIEPLMRQRVFEAWTRVVSAGLNTHSKPTDFKNQVLTVTIPSNTWFNELYSHRHKFTAQLNTFLKGCIVVKGIYFFVDESFQFPSQKTADAAILDLKNPESSPEKSTTKAISKGETFAENITRTLSDEKLREAFKKTIIQLWTKGKAE